MPEATPEFKWIFHRLGGLNQVEFRGGEEIRRLGQLDPKLWVALSCPAQGLEFDQRTLSLIDSDHDGRIRIPEVVAAAEWICARLKNPDVLLRPGDALPLDAIDTDGEAGKRLAATARAVLDSIGRRDAPAIGPDDAARAAAHASEQMLNGDGVLPPAAGLDDDMRRYIRDAIAVIGGVTDAGGQIGINQEISLAFMQTLRDWRGWQAELDRAESPLGPDTPEAWRRVAGLKDKIDDYFLRCELAAYAPSGPDRTEPGDMPSAVGETGLLDAEALAGLPLSAAAPEKPLDLRAGLNPVWREKVEGLARLIAPSLRDGGKLGREEWLRLQADLEPYARAMAARPPPATAAGLAAPPAGTPETLGSRRVDELLAAPPHERFARLSEADANGPGASTDMSDLERLILYYLHLGRLLRNFVNFADFYDGGGKASFQSGSLFLDGRSCHLCLPVEDVEAHSAIAGASQLFLLYCECTRGKKGDGAERRMHVAAAVTAGDADLLTPNRNGVFVDNRGDDWDARVVKIVANPIGLWQAVWSPYKKLGALVADQIEKYASEKQDAVLQSAGKTLSETGTPAAAGTPPPFDIGRNVGLFAAVGLALGAMGTAVGVIAGALLAMSWWQLPLLLAGIFAVISAPSVLLAWLKLRQRTLGPLLEASGWAVNGRVCLGYGLAARLCGTAELPPNSVRSELDIAEARRRFGRRALWAAGLAAALALGGWLALRAYRGRGHAGEGVREALAAVVRDLEAQARRMAEEGKKAAAPANPAAPAAPAAPAVPADAGTATPGQP